MFSYKSSWFLPPSQNKNPSQAAEIFLWLGIVKDVQKYFKNNLEHIPEFTSAPQT